MLGSGRERRPGPGPGSTVLEDLEPDQPNDMGGRDSVDTVGVTLNALPSPQADPLSAKSHRSISSVESTSSVATVTAANSNPDPFANPPHPITPDLPPEPAPQVDSPPQNPFFAPGELSPSPQSSFLSPPPRNTPRTRPSLQAQESSFVGSANPQSSKRIPPPIPLDIPMPPTPPPRITSPIEPQTPIPIALEEEELESDREGRWWTDWLCGCRETGARRSDSQVRESTATLVIILAHPSLIGCSNESIRITIFLYVVLGHFRCSATMYIRSCTKRRWTPSLRSIRITRSIGLS
jgi:hypothetical protein